MNKDLLNTFIPAITAQDGKLIVEFYRKHGFNTGGWRGSNYKEKSLDYFYGVDDKGNFFCFSEGAVLASGAKIISLDWVRDPKIGDKVVIKKTSRFFHQQGDEKYGIIIAVRSDKDFDVEVRINNNDYCYNFYRDLLFYEENISQKNEMNYSGTSLEGFPEEIVEKMLFYQEEQGNIRDIHVFEKGRFANSINGGFTWEDSPEGHSFWTEIIEYKNFDLFFERFPKQSKQLNKHKHGSIKVCPVKGAIESGKGFSGLQIRGKRSKVTTSIGFVSNRKVSGY